VTLRAIVESRLTERFIMALIVINAITLGLETSETAMDRVGPLLLAFDTFVIAVFTVEIALRIAVHRLEFFRQPWSIFDFIVVAIAIVPATEGFQVLRALRVLRVLRVITVVPSLRRVVGALASAVPGMGAIFLLLGLVFYVFSVMATKLFGASFPEWFGTIGASAYSLFQIMTLESWSMGIVRPVMEVYPYRLGLLRAVHPVATFIACSTCSSASSSAPCRANTRRSSSRSRWNSTRSAGRLAGEAEAAREATHEDTLALGQEIRALRQELNELRTSMNLQARS
jgi:voltage-gated sodium channel